MSAKILVVTKALGHTWKQDFMVLYFRVRFTVLKCFIGPAKVKNNQYSKIIK